MRPVFSILFCFSIVALSLELSASARVSEVVTTEKLEWGYLNPLRGKLSPGAVNLWGDRTQNTATGMLVRFNKGFESPSHIHNILYRGVVIDGLLHNDDPSAEKMWMSKGSFWTQPAGESHITAANGNTNMIYLEIDSGPYLVKPSKQAFNSGEIPLNLHKNNIVWSDQKTIKHIKTTGVEHAFLWGSYSATRGVMIKLPAKFSGVISSKAKEFRAVLIAGRVAYQSNEQTKITLSEGSYIGSTAEFEHVITNSSNEDAIFYIRANGQFEVY
ncbi:DUF4437 domain-containing protein [Pseudoalteromonas umbrosa]|uniref:DUF4437 domain-containing protein n=1 Tax=Pseudoalteromonas umbrosa TaxID=3048489 RepID=UPI0024C3BFE1|nr:DUF4437 domain-containing protein [Pseudoalteromonas sp. B95]MDK1287923.1 DUF4437 domain-containing protein [Pseudoalteromonas sp. B95]